jgi:hypothetical protein
VLHLVEHAVVFRGGERGRRLDVGLRKRHQSVVALFQRANDAVEPR